MSRTFEASTLPQALRMVRQAMGPDAFLLSTRSRTDEVSGSMSYQVRASMGRASVRSHEDLPGRSPRADIVAKNWAPSMSQPSEVSLAEAEEAPAADISFGSLAREGHARPASAWSDVPSMSDFPSLSSPSLPRGIAGLRARLIEDGLSEQRTFDWVQRLMEEGQETWDERAALAGLLRTEVTFGGPLRLSRERPGRVTLVGSSGSGRTTAARKLARNAARVLPGEVLLLVLTPGQSAYPPPLEGAIVRRARTPEDAASILAEHADVALTVVDTPALHPRKRSSQGDLRTWLDAIGPTDIHAVIPATSRASDLEGVITLTRGMGASAVFLSRIDETSSLAGVLDPIVDIGMPVGYLGAGPDAQSDVFVATPEKLASFLLNNA